MLDNSGIHRRGGEGAWQSRRQETNKYREMKVVISAEGNKDIRKQKDERMRRVVEREDLVLEIKDEMGVKGRANLQAQLHDSVFSVRTALAGKDKNM